MKQIGIKIARRNIHTFRYADDTTLMAESEEDLKNLLMKMKEDSKKAGLKLNIRASLVSQLVKNLLAMQETWVRSLGWEDPYRRNGNPLQYSDLENPTDGGAW